MASQIPPSLKSADIMRFAQRATQLEQAKPVIAYWCNYWIAQQILQKELHSVDQDALVYTTTLMDKLEKFKNDHSTDETVTDDMAGKALVEQFAIETFTRADNAVRANKASRQTADTFQAAATFMELLAIWGPIEADIQQKIKFAKFHALRIAKALKAGEDPNLSNPKPEPTPASEVPPPLDPNDPEVKALAGGTTLSRQPSVVEVPDETHNIQARLAPQSSANESIHPSRAPSAPPPNGAGTPQATSGGVSPLPTDAANFYNQQGNGSPVSPDRQSLGGNYFPRMPSPNSTQTQPNFPPTLPSAPDTLGDTSPALDLPSAPVNPAGIQPGPSLPAPPTTFAAPQPTTPKAPLDSFQAPPVTGQSSYSSIAPSLPQAPPHNQHINQQQPPSNLAAAPYSPPILTPGPPAPPAPQPRSFAPPPAQAPQPVPPIQPIYAPVPQPVMGSNVVADEEAMMKAQKHARWAISALNFEDVPTAIREFQLALRTLGAG